MNALHRKQSEALRRVINFLEQGSGDSIPAVVHECKVAYQFGLEEVDEWHPIETIPAGDVMLWDKDLKEAKQVFNPRANGKWSTHYTHWRPALPPPKHNQSTSEET